MSTRPSRTTSRRATSCSRRRTFGTTSRSSAKTRRFGSLARRRANSTATIGRAAAGPSRARNSRVEYRSFGNTDLKVSAIGFGTWPIGGTYTQQGYGGVDDQEAIAAIRRALDLGITCFDTAPAYGLGRAEKILGRALGADRTRVVLVTKCGIPFIPEEKRFGRDSTYGHIVQSADESLANLATDYIDVLLIHWPDPSTPLDETMRALVDLQKAGKIRYAGVSNFSMQQIDEALKS